MNGGFESANGFIWISASSGSVSRFDGSTVVNYTDPSISNGGFVEAMEAGDGMIWVISNLLGEQSNMITVFNPYTQESKTIWDHFQNKLPFSKKEIINVFKNTDGTIWISTNQGIYEYDGKRFTIWSSRLFTKDRFVQKISDTLACIINRENVPAKIQYLTKRGNIIHDEYIKTGVDAFFLPILVQDGEKTKVYMETANNPNNRNHLIISSFSEPYQIMDSVENGNFKNFRSNGKLIYKLDKTELTIFDHRLNKISGTILPENMEILFGDKQDGVWLTEGRAHLMRVYINEGKFDLHQHFLKDKIWYTASRGIIDGARNDLFMTHGGTIVNIQSNGEITTIKQPKQEKIIPDYFGLFLSRDKKSIWVADGQIIWELDPISFEFKNKWKADNIKLFWQPYEDMSGNLWFGSSHGLYFMNRGKNRLEKFKTSSQFNAIETASTFAFYENERGLWFSTSAGVFLMNKNLVLIEHYHTKGKGKFFLPHNTISHLQEDNDGSFWMSSKGGGLIHYIPKSGKFEQFTIKNGLKDNVLYACYLDDYGQIWLPSNTGLMQFDKKTKEIIHYTKVDGVPHLEFNTISHHRSQNGKLYFGGLNGTIGFDPKDFIPKQDEQSIEITGFEKVNTENIVYDNSYSKLIEQNIIVLRPNDKLITLRFALTDLSDPRNHTYQYKIDGYHQNWVNLKSPEFTINGLPYGNYTIQLRARSSGNTWQYYPKEIVLKVPKPFYFQWWFISLTILSIVLLVYMLIKRQTAQLLKRKNELEAIVSERTAEIVSQAEELKTLDKMKSQFFANISHELRTPLTLILGPVNSLKEQVSRGISNRNLEKNLGVIGQNAENLLGMVEEVLDLSKLDAGKIELNEEDVHLKSFVKRIASSFESTAELRDIKFRFIYHPSVHLKAHLDKDKLSKIINNLLSNAFKFTENGGEIQLETTEKNSTLLISVGDNGSGIDEEDLPFVFDRFYQSKTPKFTAHGGTGIGLSLCHEMTQLMNGKIWAESTIGIGSRFFVEIPKVLSDKPVEEVKEENTREHLEQSATDFRRNKQKILLVEDNADMREYVRSLLAGDYSVQLAENGQIAWNILQSNEHMIDLIISDVMMPVMDGFTLLSKLKDHDSLRSLPVILLTARAAEEDKLHALTIGVDDYLTKPFSTAELQARTKNLLQNYENRKLWQQDILKLTTNQPSEKKDQEVVDTDESANVSKHDLIWVKKVETIITENMANEDFTVELLSAKMFLSKRQFERKIKKITGLTPAKVILETRLQKAREHLENDTYQSVSEVSYSIGIQTPSYFSNVYFKRFGKRPSNYFN
ncbi:MAG: response regulator [Crocinitomicaceae bacterium]